MFVQIHLMCFPVWCVKRRGAVEAASPDDVLSSCIFAVTSSVWPAARHVGAAACPHTRVDPSGLRGRVRSAARRRVLAQRAPPGPRPQLQSADAESPGVSTQTRRFCVGFVGV